MQSSQATSIAPAVLAKAVIASRNSAETKPKSAADGLIYVTDALPGFTRRKSRDSFVFLDASGKRLRTTATIERIRSLVIPPAWSDVWICPVAHGHLQATGRDARGRKQYIYHPDIRQSREADK
jgi:DNA topoisomerase-1